MSAIIHPTSRTLRRGATRKSAISGGLAWGPIAVYLVSTSLLTVALCAAGSLGGYMLAERARNHAIQADARAATAEATSTRLRSEIDRLKSTHAIERWASVNGFVPSYRVTHEQEAVE